ncbi:MAG: sugar transferase [Spirochaetia bacterium]|nr:sugar transferase [Spirochaetia bacterium]
MLRFLKNHKIGFIVFLLDTLGVIFIFNFVYLIYFKKPNEFNVQNLSNPTIALVLIGLTLVFYVLDNYNPKSTVFGLDFIKRTPLSIFFTTLLISGILFLTPYRYEGGFSGRGIFFLSLLGYMLYATLLRWIIHLRIKYNPKQHEWLIIGAENNLENFMRDLKSYNFNGHFKIISNKKTKHKNPYNVLEYVDLKNIKEVLKSSYEGIIISSYENVSLQISEDLIKTRLKGTPIYDLTDFYEEFWQKIPVFHIQNQWFILSHGFNLLHNPIGLRLKQFMDYVLAFTLFMICTPLLLLIGIIVGLSSKGPIIYKQVRTGLGGKNFTIYKFRSMVADAEKNGARWADKNDNRITKIGKFMRASRLDELPQLINIIKGDMSFVGPRPERPEFNEKLEKEIPFYDLRHLIKPGLTGWAQTMYPYAASIEDTREKLQYDIYYIKNYSLFLDIIILFKTLKVVLRRKGL